MPAPETPREDRRHAREETFGERHLAQHVGARCTACAHAVRVLSDVGVGEPAVVCSEPVHPDDDWASSGAQWLTGLPEAAPLAVAAPVAACARGAALALAALSPTLAEARLDAPALLAERAAVAGLERAGRTTAGGAGRLLRTHDGWIALQLPRPDDVDALPALLEVDAPSHATDPFDWAAPLAKTRTSAEWVERGRWLGMAVAGLPDTHPDAEAPSSIGRWLERRAPRHAASPRCGPGTNRPMRVLDLSTLWAGPLCASLLARAGADVVKVEHPGRPDGARFGPAAFFDLMHGDKSNVALDPTEAGDRDALLDLIAAADLVIESARPRALAQLGIDAEACVDAHPGLGWIRITGHGGDAVRGDWIAFGDDAAVAAGLVAHDHAGRPVFCADAVADPLAGLHAAVAALAAARTGGGLYDVSLSGVARRVVETPRLEERRVAAAVAHPRARTVTRRARAIGADTRAVQARWLPPQRPRSERGRC